MDVMQSRIKTGQSLKEITADIFKEQADNPAQRVTNDGGSTDWLLEGLKIEDEQYALSIMFPCPY